MSSSRGSSGETSWSECSRTSLRDRLLDSNSLKCIFDNETGLLTSSDEFDGNPGKNIKADEQCRLFLKAFTALAVDNGGQRCQVLLCKQRPTDASIFKAGPALQGKPEVYFKATRNTINEIDKRSLTITSKSLGIASKGTQSG